MMSGQCENVVSVWLLRLRVREMGIMLSGPTYRAWSTCGDDR